MLCILKALLVSEMSEHLGENHCSDFFLCLKLQNCQIFGVVFVHCNARIHQA